MRAREAAISRNVDSVFHSLFLYWLPLYYVICQVPEQRQIMRFVKAWLPGAKAYPVPDLNSTHK